MESAGYFVTFHDSTTHQQERVSSSGIDIMCCPVCASKAAIVRTRRPRIIKLFTQKKLYLCRQCKTQFWR